MFKKLLIANRGEIAVRIIQACRELDIIPVAIFSEPDRESRHVKLAGETWKLEGPPNQVYLDASQILELAKKSGAEAIHPGYGFLAENGQFAEDCTRAGITFVGPGADVIRKMGSKVHARQVMEKAGVPVVPGTIDPVTDPEKVKEIASRFGYPIAIKASAGGGGRGLRVVRNDSEVDTALAGAQREGASYFGSPEVYVEKYLDKPRHIEVQVLGDNHGNVIHLYERDCSSQRRHQKLLEETPAAKLDPQVKEKLLQAAVRGTRALGYTSAGTLEFLVSGEDFYFLEMNTRVQVEHPITEMTTGVDIVKEQILIATGEKLSVSQEDFTQRGHSIECRINAEDPDKNFMPNPGTITDYVEPQHPFSRVDSASYPGYQVLPFYDSLLAKLVVWGRNRPEAIQRMRLALNDFVIEGVKTTIPFHLALLDDPTYQAGEVHTAYVEKEMMPGWKDIKARSEKKNFNASRGSSLKPVETNGESSGARTYEVEVDQKVFKVQVTELVPAGAETGKTAGTRTPARRASRSARSKPGASGEITSSMHGLVKELLVKKGDQVKSGQRLIVFEAMKMESDIVADMDGTIGDIKVKVGQTVERDSLLLTIS
ncbi:MAG: acetyl-CoA carboxylase biotin carboxylase subunit [Cyanobacteria bacterium HKST-UBA02]|nr:acetyl-CoA carboxylase biotin carboxylase subunit [Cyanobacteria bacterium HKST-UBA02]